MELTGPPSCADPVAGSTRSTTAADLDAARRHDYDLDDRFDERVPRRVRQASVTRRFDHWQDTLEPQPAALPAIGARQDLSDGGRKRSKSSGPTTSAADSDASMYVSSMAMSPFRSFEGAAPKAGSLHSRTFSLGGPTAQRLRFAPNPVTDPVPSVPQATPTLLKRKSALKVSAGWSALQTPSSPAQTVLPSPAVATARALSTLTAKAPPVPPIPSAILASLNPKTSFLAPPLPITGSSRTARQRSRTVSATAAASPAPIPSISATHPPLPPLSSGAESSLTESIMASLDRRQRCQSMSDVKVGSSALNLDLLRPDSSASYTTVFAQAISTDDRPVASPKSPSAERLSIAAYEAFRRQTRSRRATVVEQVLERDSDAQKLVRQKMSLLDQPSTPSTPMVKSAMVSVTPVTPDAPPKLQTTDLDLGEFAAAFISFTSPVQEDQPKETTSAPTPKMAAMVARTESTRWDLSTLSTPHIASRRGRSGTIVPLSASALPRLPASPSSALPLPPSALARSPRSPTSVSEASSTAAVQPPPRPPRSIRRAAPASAPAPASDKAPEAVTVASAHAPVASVAAEEAARPDRTADTSMPGQFASSPSLASLASIFVKSDSMRSLASVIRDVDVDVPGGWTAKPFRSRWSGQSRDGNGKRASMLARTMGVGLVAVATAIEEEREEDCDVATRELEGSASSDGEFESADEGDDDFWDSDDALTPFPESPESPDSPDFGHALISRSEIAVNLAGLECQQRRRGEDGETFSRDTSLRNIQKVAFATEQARTAADASIEPIAVPAVNPAIEDALAKLCGTASTRSSMDAPPTPATSVKDLVRDSWRRSVLLEFPMRSAMPVDMSPVTEEPPSPAAVAAPEPRPELKPEPEPVKVEGEYFRAGLAQRRTSSQPRNSRRSSRAASTSSSSRKESPAAAAPERGSSPPVAPVRGSSRSATPSLDVPPRKLKVSTPAVPKIATRDSSSSEEAVRRPVSSPRLSALPSPTISSPRHSGLPSPMISSPSSPSLSSPSLSIPSLSPPSSPSLTVTWRSTLSDARYAELLEQHGQLEMKRQEVIWELCETERAFVEGVRGVLQIFSSPLRTPTGTWITGVPICVAKLFDWLDDIANLHSDINQAILEARDLQASGNVCLRVADYFLRFVPRFEVHQPYLVRFQSVAAAIEEMSADQESDFGEFVRMQSALPECGQMTLTSFLLKPMQRLTRYTLFFGQLSDLTPSNHPDHLPTLTLSHSTDAIIRVLEEVKAREDEYEAARTLQRRLRGLPPGFEVAKRDRRLITHGILRRVQVSSKERVDLELATLQQTQPKAATVLGLPTSPPQLPPLLQPVMPILRRPLSQASDSGQSSGSTSDSAQSSGWSAPSTPGTDWSDNGMNSPPLSSKSTSPNAATDPIPISSTMSALNDMAYLSSESNSQDSRRRQRTISASRLLKKAKETAIHVFIFSDMVIFATSHQDGGRLMRSKGAAKSKSASMHYRLVEGLGVSRVLGLADLSGNLDYEHLLRLNVLPYSSTGSPTDGTASTPTAVFLTLPDRPAGARQVPSWDAQVKERRRWVAAFDQSLQTSLRSLTYPIPPKPTPAPSMPRTPSDQSLGRHSVRRQEQEERAWWSARFHAVRKEMEATGQPVVRSPTPKRLAHQSHGKTRSTARGRSISTVA